MTSLWSVVQCWLPYDVTLGLTYLNPRKQMGKLRVNSEIMHCVTGPFFLWHVTFTYSFGLWVAIQSRVFYISPMEPRIASYLISNFQLQKQTNTRRIKSTLPQSNKICPIIHHSMCHFNIHLKIIFFQIEPRYVMQADHIITMGSHFCEDLRNYATARQIELKHSVVPWHIK